MAVRRTHDAAGATRARCTMHHIQRKSFRFQTPRHLPPTCDSQSGFTLFEVLVSLVLLALFAALAYGLLQSAHRQMMYGNRQVEIGHVTQTAVEHFKARVRAEGDPPIGCQGEDPVQGRYCYRVVSGYWAVYDYEKYEPESVDPEASGPINNDLLLVNVSVREDARDEPGHEVGEFSFLAFKDGY